MFSFYFINNLYFLSGYGHILNYFQSSLIIITVSISKLVIMPKQAKQLNIQTGGTYKPAEYYGGNSGRYTETPAGLATGAYGEQAAVSQGVIRGDVAGPNLSWSGGNMMTGGSGNNARNKQTGGTYKPAEYHGANSGRYTLTPAGLASGAYGEQAAVSQGVIRGDVAGPNLSWSGGNMMTGGANNARNKQAGGSWGSKTGKHKSGKKSGKKSSKKSRKQRGGGGCASGKVGW